MLYAPLVARDVHAFVAGRLRRLGQRYTSGRRVLVDELSRAERPLTTAELVAGDRRLSQSTAYRNLALLEQAGVVHKVIGGDEYGRYELAEELTGRHHHHLVCVRCGSVEDFEAPRKVERGLADAIGHLSEGTGFRAEAHRLDLLGTCANCAG
jgi:Fur family transcriptional regulator, ferric uptake regulator